MYICIYIYVFNVYNYYYVLTVTEEKKGDLHKGKLSTYILDIKHRNFDGETTPRNILKN